MNNKIIRGIAVVFICLLSAIIVKKNLIEPDKLQIIIIALLVLTAMGRLRITKINKDIVLDRRRLIKDMKRRALLVDKGKATWEKVIKKDEELILQLIGGITVSIRTLIMYIIGVGICLIMGWDLVALVFTLGHLFLIIEFFFSGKMIKKRLAPDSTQKFPGFEIQFKEETTYSLTLDLASIKNFTILPKGTVFWSNRQMYYWMHEKGFQMSADGKKWRASGESLKCLDADEVTSMSLL